MLVDLFRIGSGFSFSGPITVRKDIHFAWQNVVLLQDTPTKTQKLHSTTTYQASRKTILSFDQI